MRKYSRLSSAAVLIGTLRINSVCVDVWYHRRILSTCKEEKTHCKTRASEHIYPRPKPPPNGNKGLMQNFDIKLDEQYDERTNEWTT